MAFSYKFAEKSYWRLTDRSFLADTDDADKIIITFIYGKYFFSYREKSINIFYIYYYIL